MSLKPWYKVLTPREDLREGRPLDASEFAVHLDQVRDGRAPKDYQDPIRFFAKTFLTKTLTSLAVEVLRRLSGIKTETSPIFNMTTQFGGGKTHSLTLLYHLATHGQKANEWPGVSLLKDKAGIKELPQAATAVFVGTEFDSLAGRGGTDGTPVRKTPWGEIAWQLSGEKGLKAVAEHEKQLTSPAGEVIRRFLPADRPVLILIDELMNYISRARKSGLAAQTYNFLHNLTEEARGRDNVVLAVSIPASELEMSADDSADYSRLKKLLDRLGKAVFMSAETETAEIIRRRLFEWDPQYQSQDGKMMLSRDAVNTCNEYADWVQEHKQQIPTWFPIDHAREEFSSAYPFHPTLLSVFQRKWQSLPRFQQTRGILRLLALWVSRAFQDGFKGNHKDALIHLGSAPLEDPLFRAAVFEQLGESKLEAAVVTDISGKKESFATRLDKEAVDTIKKARLHRRVATTIFFESNGGTTRTEATVPEIRLAVGEPDLDIGNIETVLDSLATSCYYLSVEKNRYRFSLTPNLNKLLADRRANIPAQKIEDRLKAEIQKLFAGGNLGAGVERVYFPEKSSQVPDRPALTLVIAHPDIAVEEDRTLPWLESMTKEYGNSARIYKSGLVWVVAEASGSLREEARKLLAWEDIDNDEHELRLDETQKHQLAENLKKSQRDLKECIWRTYKNLFFLGKDQKMNRVDLGLVHSSVADSLPAFIITRLRNDGEVEHAINPNFLVRNWPPALREWSTRSVRDAFFASPLFPKLLNADVIKETIVRGVGNGILAYVVKDQKGDYQTFIYKEVLPVNDVEISESVYIIPQTTAEEYLKSKKGPPVLEDSQVIIPPSMDSPATAIQTATMKPHPQPKETSAPEPANKGLRKLGWSGDVPPQKWMNFYTKVLTRFARSNGLKLTVKIEITPSEGLTQQQLEETRQALKELGLPDLLDID
ncbi:MAG: putative ATPase (AAA+ superfamily) [Candidatus Ozemobacter sibiricus]|jgi:hypothetical protein|uniref:Putative ATPase (AAA+ superfamily) n=1 Tax=Candidatus Ozemobacter sibiricus TaxID=2268124 RepID=A0A367ZK42_9BACT|nr:MAG: putative ATPase (AAA+ superfamily) [Candidatus Ozemobacter sibiricus]